MSGGGGWLIDIAIKLVGPLLTPIIAYVLYYLLRGAYRSILSLSLARAALRAVARKRKDGAWVEGPGFWLKEPIKPPQNYALRMQASIPILMIATLKGGVGKTTLAGSLAAHFAMKWTKGTDRGQAPLRVLLIDLDFQGSLSTMTVVDEKRFDQPSKASRLVSGGLGDGQLRDVAEPISREDMQPTPTISTVPAYYDLAQAENRTLIEWLLPLSDHDLVARILSLLRLRAPDPPRSHRDVRYLLAEALLEPQVQACYDLVIIDAPPRLTTAHVQAMCASTHLLIPTIVDRLSADAVARYADQVATHKLGPPGNDTLAICPHINTIGVVGTMVPPLIDISGPINLLRQTLEDTRLRPQVFDKKHMIHQRPAYRRCAGERIAYAAVEQSQIFRKMREEVDGLGLLIGDRLGAGPRGWTYRET
jgi:cellulose biosynthesis protein BcsQ